jgi:AcrR family transcriptional regulator
MRQGPQSQEPVTKRAWGAAIQNREEKFELKRRAVLLSAARIMRRVGFGALSLGDIAMDLHVAKPTIYYYFHNKEEIVRELMEIAVATFLDPADHPADFPEAEGLTGQQQFERFVRRCIRVTNDDVGACLFAVYPSQIAPEMRRDLETLGQPIVSWCEGIMRRGIADGSIKPCDPVVVYNFMLNGLRAVPLLVDMGRGTSETLAEAVASLLAYGIKTGG